MSVAVVSTPALSLDQLEDQITELAAHIYAATCRWLLLIAEFDERQGWAGAGCKSCAHWLSWRCSVDLGAAREQVRVARRLSELPLVRAGFERGELSYSKVRAISRIATEATEETLVEWARHSTAAQMERIVRAHRSVAGADVDAAQAAHARRFLAWHWEDDGTLAISGRLSPEDGVAFVAALEGEVAEFAATGGSADEEAAEAAEHPHEAGRGARSADALARLVDVARTAVRSPGASAQVTLHVDAATLAGGEIHDRCHFDDGPTVPPETARRLSCDASVVTLIEHAGRTLDAGRRTRTIHPALRRALENRDGGCAFPGCCSRRALAAHHVHHWALGGATDRDNLVLLCKFHHRLVHEGGYRVRRMRCGFAFSRPDGTPMLNVPPPIEGRADEVRRGNAAVGTEIDAVTCVAAWGGKLDVGMATASLCELEDRAA